MPALDPDKAAFSERLRSALKRAPKSIHTASQLAHQFNLRYEGEPITDQAAQKWLQGKARPSAEKLDTLAQLLGVTAYWLKNGNPPPTAKKATPRKAETITGALSGSEIKLLSRLRTLSEHQAGLISELVEQLAIERELAGHS